MQKAKKKAIELLGADLNEEKNMDGLKPAINNLLQMYLPNNLSIKQLDILSLVINDIIWNPEKYLTESD